MNTSDIDKYLMKNIRDPKEISLLYNIKNNFGTPELLSTLSNKEDEKISNITKLINTNNRLNETNYNFNYNYRQDWIYDLEIGGFTYTGKQLNCDEILEQYTILDEFLDTAILCFKVKNEINVSELTGPLSFNIGISHQDNEYLNTWNQNFNYLTREFNFSYEAPFKTYFSVEYYQDNVPFCIPNYTIYLNLFQGLVSTVSPTNYLKKECNNYFINKYPENDQYFFLFLQKIKDDEKWLYESIVYFNVNTNTNKVQQVTNVLSNHKNKFCWAQGKEVLDLGLYAQYIFENDTTLGDGSTIRLEFTDLYLHQDWLNTLNKYFNCINY